MKKCLLVLLTMIGILISINVEAITVTETINNGSQSSWNETFTTSENKTFWITLPKKANIIEAKLNISGYNDQNASLCPANDCETNFAGAVNLQGDATDDLQIWFNHSLNFTITSMRMYGKNASGTIENMTFNVTGYICETSEFANRTCIGTQTKVLEPFNVTNFLDRTWFSVDLNTSFDVTASNIYYFTMNVSTTTSETPEWYWVDSSDSTTNPECGGRGNFQNEWNGYDTYVCTAISIKFVGNISYPNNTYLDVSNDGDLEWQFTEELNHTKNRTTDFSSEITSYLSTCTVDSNGNCTIPFILHSDRTGIIQVNDINITYNHTPYWYTNQSSIPVNYSSTNTSLFNITWNTSIGFISKVFFESNYSGTSTNYTMTNNTYGGDIYNYSVVIPLGTYYWRSFANDSANDWNVTGKWEFTISKGNSSFSSSYSPTDPKNLPSSTITFTVSYNASEGIYITENCTLTIEATEYDMDYSSGEHTETVSIAGWSAHGYDYTILCFNTSYKNQTTSGTFTVTGEEEGGGGGGGGGGFTGFASPEQAQEAFEELVEPIKEIIKPFESPVVRIEFLFIGLSIIGIGYYQLSYKKRYKTSKRHAY